MRGDDFWIVRIRDNRISGALQELRSAIEGCDDADRLHALSASLRIGFANYARARSDKIRGAK